VTAIITFQKSMRRYVRELLKKPIITNYNGLGKPLNKKALLSYITFPLLFPPILRRRVALSHAKAELIPQALNELGYTVDIVDCENVTWQPREAYDLFVGHGGWNFYSLAEQVKGDACCIYLATGMYWQEHNALEAERFASIVKRKGVSLEPDRKIVADEEQALRVADGIICLANQRGVKSYKPFQNVAGLNNVIYTNLHKWYGDRDHEVTRKHFLFFSGRGNVHKGLDLLLEAFAETPNLHLHICQHLDTEFEALYHDMLFRLPNIHYEGFIGTKSKAFKELCSSCSWVILPSSADFQPRSVLECMACGLIPIIPDTVCIDVGELGVRLETCEISYIREIVTGLSLMDPIEIAHRSDLISEKVTTAYSPDAFVKNFKVVIGKIQDNLVSE
jgi:glycosyltransferase involved in cell wall biosynthesis